jgi:hypothetical protein
LIEYDVTDVEESGGGTGVKVPIGLRVAKIALCEQRETKANGQPANDIRLGLDMGPEYDWVFTYVGLGPESDWKLAEFIRALNLKDKGKLDPAKQVGKLIRVKINHGEYNNEYAPDAGKLMAPQDGDEVGGLSASAAAAGESNAIDAAVASPTADDGGFVASREDDPEVGSYDDWEEDDLAAEVEDRGLTLPGGRGNKKDKLVKALREDDNAASDAGDAGGGGGDDAYEPAYADGFEPSRESDPEVGSYDDWEEDDLKAEVTDRGLTVPGGRGSKKDKLIVLLREEDVLADGGGGAADDAPDADSGDDYDNWELDALKKEWEERTLGDLPSFRGGGAADRVKAAIVTALREDDGANPFS